MTDKTRFEFPKIQIPTVNLDAIAEVRNTPNYIQDFVKSFDEAIAGFRNNFNGDFLSVRNSLGDVLQGWSAAIQGLADAMQGTIKDTAAKQALRERGILPHKSTPWELFDQDKPDDFADQVLSYYSTRWDQARTVFLTDINAYKIGEEAREAFIEGIECHTSKLYRPAILTALPAAEIEFRRTFEIAPGGQGASLLELRNAVMDAPAGLILSHVAPFDLFETLDKHLYEKIRTQVDVGKFAADPIPNRHAAIHGLIHYKSELSSLNALIVTDYVFFLISQIADHLEPAD